MVGGLVSPATRNHMWLENGWHATPSCCRSSTPNGRGRDRNDVHDTYVEALTVDNIRVIQSARLEDYSPEYWALTAGKGAAVLHMLRFVDRRREVHADC